MITTTKRDQAIADIIAFFEDNEEVFNDCIEELDSHNGCLGDDRYYYMEDLDEIYRDTDPTELLARAFHGYDEESWHTDSSGNKVYDEFCPHRDYFRFNGYGNLVSADYKDYSAQLDHWAVEAMQDNRRYIYTIDDYPELTALFDALDEDDDEEGGNDD